MSSSGSFVEPFSLSPPTAKDVEQTEDLKQVRAHAQDWDKVRGGALLSGLGTKG